MKKFTVKYSREFTIEIEAENTDEAEKTAKRVLNPNMRLLSIIQEGCENNTITHKPAFTPAAVVEKAKYPGGIDDLVPA